MPLTIVSRGLRQVYLVRADRLLEQALGISVETAAGDVYPAALAQEAHLTHPPQAAAGQYLLAPESC